MNRLMKFLRYHSGPGVLVALVVLVLAVGVGLGSGEGVGRWRDVEAGGAGGAGALGVPGVLVALAVLVSAVGVGLGSGDGVGRWRGGGAGRQAMAEVWSLLCSASRRCGLLVALMGPRRLGWDCQRQSRFCSFEFLGFCQKPKVVLWIALCGLYALSPCITYLEGGFSVVSR